MTAPRKRPPAAWQPPPWEPSDAAAIQALARGEADADQQRRAIRWIVETAASAYDMHYRPESPRDTDFALGRAFVGQQVVKLSKINLSKLKEKTP